MADRRIAVIGAGPAGFYSVQALLNAEGIAGVDLFDAVPAPFGLVRYGVAPDHPKTKAVARIFQRLLTDERVRFFGNVTVGRDISRQELLANYDAVIYATGARRDRSLGIPGEDLDGSFGAAEFVSWYSGHPDSTGSMPLAQAQTAVVVGAGNVALDVARILAKDAQELVGTDMPDEVLAELAASSLSDIHVVARGGPRSAKFTKVELREFGELAHADIAVSVADLDAAGTSSEVDSADAEANFRLLSDYSSRSPAGRPRRVHLHFWTRPVVIRGAKGVEEIALSFEPPAGHAKAPSLVDLPAQIAIRAIGYRPDAPAGLPCDPVSGVVPNEAGRVVADGVALPGEYVAGWLKRGPSGVIGTNRSDARETVDRVLEDLPALAERSIRDPQAVVGLLAERGTQIVDATAWARIDLHEQQLGRVRGAATVKERYRGRMVEAALRGDGITAD